MTITGAATNKMLPNCLMGCFEVSESLHRKLSVLAAKTGRKKVDIVRILLDEALKDVDV